MKKVLNGFYRLRARSKLCDWPSETDAERKLAICREDVLTWNPEREAFTKVCGVYYHGIVIPEDEVEWFDEEAVAEFVM